MKTNIFSNAESSNEINEVINVMMDYYKKSLNFKDSLLTARNWKEEKINSINYKELRAFFETWRYDKNNKSLISLHLYDRRALQGARKIQEAILKIKDSSYSWVLDTDEVISLRTLTKLSLMNSDNTHFVFGIMRYVIANYERSKLKNYLGILPLTKNVTESLDTLFGLDLDQYEATLFCIEQAKIYDMSPIEINLRLFSLG